MAKLVFRNNYLKSFLLQLTFKGQFLQPGSWDQEFVFYINIQRGVRKEEGGGQGLKGKGEGQNWNGVREVKRRKKGEEV